MGKKKKKKKKQPARIRLLSTRHVGKPTKKINK